ncbi:MAG: ABC transporter substrate-binding protein, partial [Nannocystaceae bacterium]|nr:ABC transporter substrate-binding protein [Nannocystaceae bacterium]
AVRCWLVARGSRAAALMGPLGELDVGPIDVASLGSAPSDTIRLITLAPSNAEIVHALGCFDRVVACEDSSDHPPRTADLPRLGPDLGPDLARTAELAPGLVVSSLSVPGMERIVTGLRARGVPQVVLAPRSLADVCADVGRVAALLGVPDVGLRVVADIDAQRRALAKTRPAEPVPVYLEWWPKPMFTPGIDCFSNELIDLAGGHNVFGTRPGSSLQIEPDDVLEANPAICFVSWCGVAEAKLDPGNLIGRPGLESLSAARQGHVYALDEQFSGRPGPRMLEAARRMAAKIRGL